MAESLPHGWVRTTLGDITKPTSIRVSPRDYPDMRYVGLEHVEQGSMRLVGHAYGNEVRSNSVLFFDGDVLYSRMRPYLNKVWVAEFDGICSGEFLVFPLTMGFNNSFLAARLNAPDFVQFANARVSGERPRVSFSKLESFRILLPPSAEQERIVSKLRETFLRMERGIAATQRAQERLDRYRAAVIEAGVSGDLTTSWRLQRDQSGQSERDLLRRVQNAHRAYSDKAAAGTAPRTSKKQPEAPSYRETSSRSSESSSKVHSGWIRIAWDQIGFSQNGRVFPSSQYSAHGIKLLRPGNLFPDGSVQWTESNTRYLPSKWEREYPQFIVRGHELVINLTAQSLKDDFLGRVCLTSNDEHCLLNQRLARLTPVFGEARFFLYTFKSAHFRRFVEGLNSGSLIQHMFTSQLSAFSLALPPTEEQQQIVQEVERRLSAARTLKVKLDEQLDHATSARTSVLLEAFAGQLVEQNSHEEPASALLGRLLAAQQKQTKQDRVNLMPKPKLARNQRAARSLLEILKSKGKPMTPEELFRASGYSDESVDEFYAELRQLTDNPQRIQEERKPRGAIVVRAIP